MVDTYYTYRPVNSQSSRSFTELEEYLTSIDESPLLERLKAYRPVGRKGYCVKALWRAYASSFFLGLPSTNALIRRLQDDSQLRAFCGFRGLPHRTTFNRFINRLALHQDLLDEVFAQTTNEIKKLLPDLGEEVAVDSTAIKSYSNPNRRSLRDHEATWAPKHSARAKKNGEEYYWGFKLHMVADANYGLPLGQFVTTAKDNDNPMLPDIIAKAESLFSWFKPRAVMADRGYDSRSNHEFLHRKGILPIIHIRRKAGGGLYEGIYTEKGVPTCVAKVPMRYVKTDPDTGHHLYRCGGCHLAKSYRGGIRHCDTEVWEDPSPNIRLFGVIRRDSPEWDALYHKRQAIERRFKSLKQSVRLEHHYVRGRQKVSLHARMSVLTGQARSLAKVRDSKVGEMGWMVRKVA